MQFDYLIVGAGLYGATFADLMRQTGKRCLVIESRDGVGGNIRTDYERGIHVHKYGAHIFHTSDEWIWKYVNLLTDFDPFINSPVALGSDGKYYNLPFNMNTFNQMWGVTSPSEVKRIIQSQIEQSGIKSPKNLEEQAISLVGSDIYTKLIKFYTEKQWGRSCSDLPADIIKRLPVRFTFNNNYFNDKYQGIPASGYTALIEKMLEGTDVILNTDYFSEREKFDSLAKKVVYTGQLDRFFDYRFGRLEYRSLDFKSEWKDTDNFQGNAVINNCGPKEEYPFTRTIEHRHFMRKCDSAVTCMTWEFPKEWDETSEPYYPINNSKNMELKSKYLEFAKTNCPNVIFGGRLGTYSYLDMDKVILLARDDVNKELDS